MRSECHPVLRSSKGFQHGVDVPLQPGANSTNQKVEKTEARTHQLCETAAPHHCLPGQPALAFRQGLLVSLAGCSSTHASESMACRQARTGPGCLNTSGRFYLAKSCEICLLWPSAACIWLMRGSRLLMCLNHRKQAPRQINLFFDGWKSLSMQCSGYTCMDSVVTLGQPP